MLSTKERRALRAQRIAVVVWTVIASTMLFLAPVEESVWAPLAMTDDSYDLAAIYGVLDGATLVVGFIGIGIAFMLGAASIATFAFLGLSGRVRAHWVHVSFIGSVLVWLGLLAIFFASFGIGNTVSDEIPPRVGSSSPVGYALQHLALAAFLVTVLSLLASVVLGVRAWRSWKRSQPRPEHIAPAR